MRPHDLLRLKPGVRLVADDAPAWVGASLRRAPFVVVRRAGAPENFVAVGVRGSSRGERFAAAIHRDDIEEIVTPEFLARTKSWRSTSRCALPIFDALNRVDAAAAAIELTWGPGGSAGFELAANHPTVTDTSDLDIIIRPTSAHTRDELLAFRDAMGASAVRVDVVIEASHGAVALDDWLSSPLRVMIKTSDGPVLGAFSW